MGFLPAQLLGMPALLARVAFFPFYFCMVSMASIFIGKLLTEQNRIYAHKSISFIHATKVASIFY
jgi:hypothetical protein